MKGPSASRPANRTTPRSTAANASSATRGEIGGSRRAGAAMHPQTSTAMDPSKDPARAAPEPPAKVPAEARQRLRLAYGRSAEAASMLPKEIVAAWESGLAASGLPLAGLDLPIPRPRVVFGAPVPVGVSAEQELLDLFLVARTPIADARDGITRALPPGHEIVDLHDVWLGERALPGQVCAADYRLRIRAADGAPLELGVLAAACSRLLAAESLPRTRDKGGRPIAYDLRPLLASASPDVVDAAGVATLRIRTRFDQERGVGRPEEVVAAIGDMLGAPLAIEETVRERLLLFGDP